MGAESLTKIYTSTPANKKYMNFQTNKKNPKESIEFTETWFENINNYSPDNNIVQYCIIPPLNGFTNCANLFSDNPLDNTTIHNAPVLDGISFTNDGGSCRTFIFRPGVVIKGGNIASKFVDPYVRTGQLCRLNYTDMIINPSNVRECCLNQTCDNEFSDNFQSHTCDTVMSDYCLTNFDQPICMTWLENRTDNYSNTGMDVYQKICSENMEEDVCTYFSLYANNKVNGYYYDYADKALDTFCTNNPDNKNCHCYLAKKNNKVVQEMSETLGPSECWLLDCTSKLKDLKWITHEQAENKKKCNGINCVISIKSLVADENSIINLNNFCLSKNTETSSIGILNTTTAGNNITKEQTWGSQFNLFYLLFFFSICIMCLIIFRNI